MANGQDTYQQWSAEVTLGAGETSHVIQAAPGANKTLVVTFIVIHILTSAAQAADITIGATNILRLPASLAAGSEAFFGPLIRGIVGAANTALVITPAAAGPAIHVVAEGYTK